MVDQQLSITSPSSIEMECSPRQLFNTSAANAKAMFKHSWILALILVLVAAFACGCVSEEEAGEAADTEELHEESAVSAEEEVTSAPMEEIDDMEEEAEEMGDHAEDEGEDMAEAAVGEVEPESGH